MKMIFEFTIASATLLTFPALAGHGGADEGPKVLTEFVRSEKSPRNSEGDVVELRDGRLLIVYSQYYADAANKFAGGHDNASARIVACESADGGRTWSAPRTVAEKGATDLNVMSASFLRLKDGALALFYLVKRSSFDCRPAMRVSRDEGRTWSAPSLCIADADARYYVMNNARAVSVGGRILLPLARHNPVKKNGRTEIDWSADILTLVSDDDGKSWRFSADFRRGPGKVGLQEPGIVPLADGRLMMYARSSERRQWAMFSTDRGDHWTAPAPIEGYSTTTYSPVTYTRLANGDLVLVYPDATAHPKDEKPVAYERRWPLAIAVSKDDGRTWRRRVLEPDAPGLHCCYFAVREIGDRLILVFCHRDGLGTTRVTSVPLAWLYASASTETETHKACPR